MKSLPIVLLLALVSSVPAFAGEGDIAREWLSRMSRAARDLNYEGTFIYEHQGQVQSMQIFHGPDRERLVTLDGSSREVIRENGKVMCILPDNKAVMVDDAAARTLPMSLPTAFEQLEQYYSAQVVEGERVTDRAARKVAITPRDGFRYGQNIWLDETTGLLLKAELVDEHGKMIERLMFTSLRVHDKPLPAGVFKSNRAEQELTWYGHEPEDASDVQSTWRVERLPPGFQEKLRRRHFLPKGQEPVEHRVFSDGLASVSVFIEPEGSKDGFIGSARKGAVQIYARKVGHGHRVIVLGEVPEQTVRLIGDSVVDGEAQR